MGILKINEQSLLVQAVFSQNAEMVDFLLEQHEDVNELDHEWRTALHAAAYVGGVYIMELLISSGADVNAKDQDWLTPLHRAAASQNEVREDFKISFCCLLCFCLSFCIALNAGVCWAASEKGSCSECTGPVLSDAAACSCSQQSHEVCPDAASLRERPGCS